MMSHPARLRLAFAAAQSDSSLVSAPALRKDLLLGSRRP